MRLQSLQVEGKLSILVKDDALVPTGFRITPAEGAKDDRIFEPFAFVDSNDSHGLFVALQPLLILFRTRGVRVLNLFGEPFERARYSEPVLNTHGMQELGEMKYVGKTPLAGRVTEQPRANTLLQQQGPQHLDKTSLAPKLMILLKLYEPRVPRMVIEHQRVQVVPGYAQCVGCQRRLD